MATGICDNCPDICKETDNLINVVSTDITGIIDTINLSVSNAIQGSLDRGTYYQYLPILLFILSFIWILVAVGTFDWVLGIILSAAVVILLFLFLVAFRNTLITYLDNLYLDTKQQVQQGVSKLENDTQIAYRQVLTAIENCSNGLDTGLSRNRTLPGSLCL